MWRTSISANSIFVFRKLLQSIKQQKMLLGNVWMWLSALCLCHMYVLTKIQMSKPYTNLKATITHFCGSIEENWQTFIIVLEKMNKDCINIFWRKIFATWEKDFFLFYFYTKSFSFYSTLF